MADESQTRPFADFLREHAGGRSHNELSETLKDLVKAVSLTHKAGSLTLTITVKPMKDNVDALIVSDKIVAKVPQLDRKVSVFYATSEGNLVRDDPNQLTFGSLTDVSDEEPEREPDARERAAGGKDA